MLTYEERARVLWSSLSLADKQRVHGFLTIDGNASWKFDSDKIADLCESCPEIPLALRAMIATDERTASPNVSSDECLARASVIFEHAETIARTVSNRFGEEVTEDTYKQLQFRLVKGRKLRGWKAVPVATTTQIINLYAFNTTITPPRSNGNPGEEARQKNLRLLWERAKMWCAPRDCGRLQRLLDTIEEELPHKMRPVVKEEDALADEAEARAAALEDDLEDGRTRTDQIYARLDSAATAAEIQRLEDGVSRWDRTRRRLCEELRAQEARAKYLRWGGRPLGRFDPFYEIQFATKGLRSTDGELDSGLVVMVSEDWRRWVAGKEQHATSGSAPASGEGPSGQASAHSFDLNRLPIELRDCVWESAVRSALDEAARSLPDDLVREAGFASEGYHQFGCRCHSFWRHLRPFLSACKESREAVAKYTKILMVAAGDGEDGDLF